MKALSVLVIMFMIPVSVTIACADEYDMNWASIQFDPIKNSPTEAMVDAIVRGVSQKEESQYTKSLRLGKTWLCIVQILDEMIVFQSYLEKAPEEDLLVSLVREHSGRSWSFWRSAAAIGQARENGSIEVKNPELNRVLSEMKEAFMPVLSPMDLDRQTENSLGKE